MSSIEDPDIQTHGELVETPDGYAVTIPEDTVRFSDEFTVGSGVRLDAVVVDSGPPVERGDVLEVKIEDVGDKGDGITRIDEGYVVIVEDTQEINSRHTVEIKSVRSNYAFAVVT